MAWIKYDDYKDIIYLYLNKEHSDHKQQDWKKSQHIDRFLCFDRFIDTPKKDSYRNNESDPPRQ